MKASGFHDEGKEMCVALTVHPTDGFINRLLQESARPASQSATGKESESDGKDQASTSSATQQENTSLIPDTQLESKLLQMYHQNGVESS